MPIATQQWDLERIFPGGPTSAAWFDAMGACDRQVAELLERVQALPPIAEAVQVWNALLVEVHEVGGRAGELQAVAYCYNSAHTDDSEGRRALGVGTDVVRRLEALFVPIEAAIGEADDATLAALATGELAPRDVEYQHVKASRALSLDPQLQALLVEADRDGLHGWGQLYDTLTGSLRATMTVEGKSVEVGVSQAAAKRADADPAVRRAAFESVNAAYSTIEDTCAAALTHIIGARQTRLDRVGADELDRTLLENRVDRETLAAMWEGARTVRPTLIRYLELKSRLLGHDGKLPWWDVYGPVGTAPSGTSLSWEDAQRLILDAFAGAEPELAKYADRLLSEGGIEAEDRDGKRGGGYCASFQNAETSRIFMTFTGSVDNAITLAHELGHAWHSHVLFEQPRGRRMLTAGLAESASTYAENIVRDQVLAAASDPAVRLYMRDQQLQAGVAFLMNIQARFDFERALYGLRRQGPFQAAQLSETILGIEREAHADALSDYDPMFWATKLHFYISDESFYNWSYAFGYLFSSAIYARARAEGPSFRPVVRELLTRTGWQDCRGLAAETLGVELRDPAFWAAAASPLEDSLREFEALHTTSI